MTGRATGRARGRARGAADQAEPAPRRPGDTEPPKPPAHEQASAQAVMPGSGRASHRGGARGEPRPGADLAQGVAAMNIGAGEPRKMGPRQREDLDAGVHTRPESLVSKRGTTGGKIHVVSNYFRMNSAPNWQLYQYAVSFAPEIENRSLRQRLVKEQREYLGPTRAFDGMVLYLARRLPEPVVELWGVLKKEDTKVRITIKLTNELPPTSPQCIQMYNIIFRRVLNMINMQQIGRHYYSPEKGASIPQHKLEIWPGFITSIKQYENSVMLCAKIDHKILRMDTVLDMMYDIHDTCRGGFHDMADKKLVGGTVLTRYNNKTYRIDEIDWESTPLFKFARRDGTEISLVEYYEKQYQKKITDLDQPLLVSRPKERDRKRGQEGPILLVPELCTLTGLADEVKADFNVMKDISKYTRVGPQERCTTLNTLMSTINQNKEVEAELQGWNLNFERQLVNIEARVLPPEKIYQKKNDYSYNPASAEWSKEMRNKELISCIDLKNWAIIFLKRDADKARDFYQNIARVCPPMGIKVAEPQTQELQDDRVTTYIRTLKDIIQPELQMVVCIVPNNRKDRYDAIKKTCCLTNPIPSQVIVGRTLAKKQMLMSVATKIGIQLNCKLGGEVWGVAIPLTGLMVVGIDCYHEAKSRSVGAFVASMNRMLTRYYSRVAFQHQTQELMTGLMVFMQAALRQYNQINGALPEKIIIYRDGVGDGQLSAVVNTEIPQLLECFKEIGANWEPRVAVVVVKKRINTRFFDKVGQRLQNPPPGSIIDSEVTNPGWYDFFLVSQSVRQGTVTPTHYNIVWNTIKWSPDQMQRLTYKLTHLYYNWPGTIRVPAPCQYAHKLAYLVGQSLHDEPSLELAHKLYYL